MLHIWSIFDLWNKSLNLSYESNVLLDWFSGSSDASLPLNVETYCADKFDKFDKIDDNNLKIDNYRLLTTYPFIDFYRFSIQLTNSYRFYQLLSIIGFFDWTSQDYYGWLHKQATGGLHSDVLKFESQNSEVLRILIYTICTSFQSRRMFHFQNTAIWTSKLSQCKTPK